jgi:N-acetyl-anhydromuramyl-L-alanine amidase AmpD
LKADHYSSYGSRLFAANIKTFTKIESQVSSHYLIDDGKVVQMLNDYLRAWHAGAGTWGKNRY